ncbi:uncharacterized protein LOC142349266 [Convolutriloba macropyga]|uniref:uncharacterized protein LOC142349266 n=1 Tax=Convolutriloba macropyga TaxID=536237 RepID=UPI003F51D6E7
MSSEITNFEQFRCPICFFILIEPVSLPCNHKLCLACFDKQVEEVNYTCPICRHRISNWARNVSRENSLVDEELWKQIQAQFPAVVSDHIRSKISLGLLSAKCICLTSPCSCTSHAKHAVETPEKKAVAHHFALPGEISLEYQQELQRVRDEFRQERQDEIKASEDFILAKLSSDNKRRKLKNFLQFQQTTPAEPPTNTSSKCAAALDASGQQPSGPVRCRSATGCSSGVGASGDSNTFGTIYRSPSTSSIDSITPEVQGYLFKPIHCSPRTPPRRFGGGGNTVSSSAHKQGHQHASSAAAPTMPPFVSYPPVIRSVPRVIDGCDTSSESSFASSCSSMSNFRGGPPQKFRRRYPTRAATRRAVISLSGGGGNGSSGLISGGTSSLGGGDGSTGSSAHSGFVSPIVDSFNNMGAIGNQFSLSKGGTLVASSDSLMELVSESLADSTSSVSNRLVTSSNVLAGGVAASGSIGTTHGALQSNACSSPTNTRSGRSSRLAAPSSGTVGSKRKQQPPDEKENKRALPCDDDENSYYAKGTLGTERGGGAGGERGGGFAGGGHRVEIPEFKRLRLNPAAAAALLQQSLEGANLNKDDSAALALSASSNNKLDPSLFINSRRSGVEFLSMEAYKQFVASREAQIKMDFKLAKELNSQEGSTQCEADDSNSGSSSPIEERTYSLRKRKVNYRQ